MTRISETILVLFLTTAGTGISGKSQKPPHVYTDVGACPFECCKYGQWTVAKKVRVLDRPNGKQVIETLSKGDIVTGLTGEVISQPIPFNADRDVPDTPIKRGDTLYVLHYDGEGYWKVWLDGKITLVHEDVMEVPHPKADWWVKIRDSHGTTGWALSNGNFAHQDACE